MTYTNYEEFRFKTSRWFAAKAMSSRPITYWKYEICWVIHICVGR